MFTFQFRFWSLLLFYHYNTKPIFQPNDLAQFTADLELSRQQTKASHPQFIDLSIQLATAYQTVGNNLLNQPQWSRAQALQQAQQTLAATPAYRHPAYWASFLLIGNWL